MRNPSFIAFALAVCAAGCASAGAVPQPFPRPDAPTLPVQAPETAITVTGDGYTIAGTALSLRGAPYRNGGADPGGFDCSGFVAYVFAQHGIALPRTVEGLYRAGTDVVPGDIQAGDLVFFTTTAPGPSHVGMAIGGDEFVHAPSGPGVVRVERWTGTYWAPRFLGARRLL